MQSELWIQNVSRILLACTDHIFSKANFSRMKAEFSKHNANSDSIEFCHYRSTRRYMCLALCGTTSFSSRVLVFFKVPENSTFHVRMGSMGCSLMPPPEKVSSSSLINLAIGSQFPLNKSPCGVYRRKVVLTTFNLFPSTERQNYQTNTQAVKRNLWFSSYFTYFMHYDKYFQCNVSKFLHWQQPK